MQSDSQSSDPNRTSVTIITEYFPPEEVSTAQLIAQLAQGLSEEFDITVVTRQSIHQEDISATKREAEDITVQRIPSTKFDKDILPLRIINWVTFTVAALINLIQYHRSTDAILVLSNPPILPFAALIHQKLFSVPFSYLIYDMYPDMPVALGMVEKQNPVVVAWERAMRKLYAQANQIVVLGEAMAERVRKKMGERQRDDQEVRVIPNWEDPEFIQPVDKQNNSFAKQHGTVDKFTVIYSGNIGRFHELQTTIDAIGMLEARGRDDIQLVIIGEGARKRELQTYVSENNITNVSFLPFQPMENLPESLTCGDVSLVGNKPDLVGMNVSSKLYSSLAAGMPILATVAEGDEVGRTVKQCNCGEQISPGHAAEAAAVLQEWADNPEVASSLGENARACFEARYTFDQALQSYIKMFNSITGDDEKLKDSPPNSA